MNKLKVDVTDIITLILTSILALLIILFMCIVIYTTFCGCGNTQLVDTTYKYDRAYINLNGDWKEVKVASWRDYDQSDSIQIKTTDGKSYYTHLTNVVLIAD